MNLNRIASLTIKAKTEGAQEAAKGLQDVAKGQQAVADTSEKATKSTISAERALDRLRKQLDDTYRSQQKLSQSENVLNRARNQGLLSQAQHLQLMTAAQQQTMKLAAANDNLSKASMAAGQLLGRVGINIPGLSAGIGSIAGMTAALGGMVVAAGLAVEAFRKQEEQSLALNAVIKATGMAAGITEEDIEALADKIGNIGAVRDAATQLLTFKSIAGDTFKRTLELADDLAAAGFGNLQSATLALAKALESPAEGLTRLRRIGINFSDTQIEMIQKMVDMGQVAEAQGIILDTVAKKMGGVGAARDQGLSGAYEAISDASLRLSEAWGKQIAQATGLTTAIQNIATAMKASAKAMTDPVAALDQQIALNQKLLSMFPEWLSFLPARSALERELNGLLEQRAEAMRKIAEASQVAVDQKAAADTARRLEEERERAQAVQNAVQAINDETKALQLNTVEQEVNARVKALGNGVTEEQISLIRQAISARVAEAQTISAVKSIEDQTRAVELQAKTFNMSKGEAAAYTMEQEKLAEFTKAGTTASEDQAKRIKDASVQFGAATDKLEKLKDGQKAYEDQQKKSIKAQEDFQKSVGRAFESGLAGLITDLAQGVNLTEAMARNMERMAAALIQAGTKKLTEGLGDQLGSMLGSSMGGGLATIGIGLGIQVLSSLFKDNSEQLKAAAENTKKFKDALADLNKTIKGEILGTIERQAQAFTDQANQIAQDAQEKAEQIAASNTSFIDTILDDWFGMDPEPVTNFKAMNEFANTMNEINAFIERESEKFRNTFGASIKSLTAGEGLSSVAQEITRLGDSLQAFIKDTATAFGGDTARIDEATRASQAMLLSIIGGVEELSDFEKEMNRIAETAEVVRNELIRMGMDAGAAAAAVDAQARAARDMAQAAEDARIAQERLSLQLRLLRATTDQSTLSGALAVQALEQQIELQEAIASSSANIALLQQIHEVERLNLIRDFNQRALDEQQRAQEQQLEAQRRAEQERQRIFDEAERFLDTFSRKIQQFIDSARAGQGSPLSPQARLAAAQAGFAAQLGIINTGTPAEVRAAMDSITSYAQDLIDAGFDVFGSSTAGQQIFEDTLAALEALPAQISVQELILEAIEINTDEVTTSLGIVDTSVQTLQAQLINVLNTGNLDAIRAVLQAELPSIDANTDDAIDFNELNNALGGTFPGGTLRGIFDNLDGNGDGILEKSELIKQHTDQTSTDISGPVLNKLIEISNNTLNVQTLINDELNRINDNLREQSAAWPLGFNGGLFFPPLVLHREGGWITGGTANKDSVPLAAGGHIGMPGEYVIRKSVARAHYQELPMFNATGQWPGADDAMLEQLCAEVSALRKVVWSAGLHVGERVDASADRNANGQRRISDEQRQASNRPRAHGRRAAAVG